MTAGIANPQLKAGGLQIRRNEARTMARKNKRNEEEKQ